MPTLTDEQREAVEAPGSVAVTAGAGTGKTFMLAERYLHHVQVEGRSPLEVVAATFTEKAAAELRARIRKVVVAAMPDAADTHAALEAAPIGTLHALAGRICREHPELAGVPFDFRILDEQEGALWLAERLDDVLDSLPASVFEAIPISLLRGTLHALLKDPYAAERALACAEANPTDLAKPARLAVLRELVASGAWAEAVSAIRDQSDILAEAQAVEAAVEAGVVPREALVAILDMPGYGSGLQRLKCAVESAVERGYLLLGETFADLQLRLLMPALREAYRAAGRNLAEAKRRARVLDYADLEMGALRALEHAEVRAYYADRWKAYLIDEFQDTNPVQAELLARLTSGAVVTVVGDEKQSIYSFRRADVAVFRRVRREIRAKGGRYVKLTTSYRMHDSVVRTLNALFHPILGDLHEPLDAERKPAPHAGPHIRVLCVEPVKKVVKADRMRVEASHLADTLAEMLSSGLLVHDKDSGDLRPLRPGDIAILSRSWEPLGTYGEALAARGVPTVQTGGGNLMATREAQDAWALLRFLAEPADNLALAAVLRSPFFAVDDSCLFHFARTLVVEGAWWASLKAACPPGLVQAEAHLTALLEARKVEPPSRLLQLADRLTGYTAVIANLPGAERREADWRGVAELVRGLERETADVFHVVRRLQRLIESGAELPRPLMEAGNAVALMSIHAAKGLEWPIVVVPDLSRRPPAPSRPVLFDANRGLALKLGDANDAESESVLYRLLAANQAALEEEERRRVLYVALTRVRDQLILSTCDDGAGNWALLKEGLGNAGLVPEVIRFDPELARPPVLPTPPARPLPTQVLVEPVGAGLRHLPVTALSEYVRCPKRFHYRFVDGHPGVTEGYGHAGRVGTLTHTALEKAITDEETLAIYDAQLPRTEVRAALALAERFRKEPAFEDLRSGQLAHEVPLHFEVGPLVLSGIMDAIGHDFVLDFKTDQRMHPDHHRLQLGVYAAVTGMPRAHLAYLRHGQVHTFEGEALRTIIEEVKDIAAAIGRGEFEATPSAEACSGCPYVLVCPSQSVSVAAPQTSPFLRGWRTRLPVGPMSDLEWERAITSCQSREAWAEMWGLLQSAPVRHAAPIIRSLSRSGWRPDSAGESDALATLVRLAAECLPETLAEVGCLQGLAELSPHQITHDALARVEIAFPQSEPQHHPWLAFALAVVRWHLRYEVELDDLTDELEWDEIDILLEEA